MGCGCSAVVFGMLAMIMSKETMIIGIVILIVGILILIAYNEINKPIPKPTFQPKEKETGDVDETQLVDDSHTKEVERATTRYTGKKIYTPVKNYTVIDTETTGLYPGQSEIIEIALLRIKNGKIDEQWEALVKPKGEVSEKITKLTGITNDMLENKPTIEEVIEEAIEFIGSKPVVGHNVTFDLRFLNYAYSDKTGENISNNYFDTLHYARKKLPGLENHKLITLIKHFNVADDQDHRAMSDVLLTNEIYQRLQKLE